MATFHVKRLRVGDFLELHTPSGFAYVQYVGSLPEYGDVIYVLSGLYVHSQIDFKFMNYKGLYYTFYPARKAVKIGLVRIVASAPLPKGVEVPKRLRRVGARNSDGKIITWIIEDDNYEKVRTELSADEEKLPIACIWNHELLIFHILQGWLPEQER